MSTQTYRLTISYNTAGQFAQNVLHYSFDDALFPDTTQAATALNNAFNTHCTGPLKDAIPQKTLILSYKSRRISAGGGFEAVRVGVSSDTGNRTGDVSASGLAPLIRFITNNVPPKTGRMFLPGISDSDATDGYLLSGYQTPFIALCNVLDDTLTLTGGGGPTATPVLWSLHPTRSAIPIARAVPSPYLATQRRRQRPA